MFCHLIFRFSIQIRNINASDIADASHWVYDKTNWKIKKKQQRSLLLFILPHYKPNSNTQNISTGGMDIAIDVIPFSVCPKHRDANGRWTSKKTTALEKCELRVLNLSSSNATLLFRYFGTFVVNSLRHSSISPSNRCSMDDFVSFYLSFGCILYLWSDAMHQKSNAKQTIKN